MEGYKVMMRGVTWCRIHLGSSFAYRNQPDSGGASRASCAWNHWIYLERPGRFSAPVRRLLNEMDPCKAIIQRIQKRLQNQSLINSSITRT